VSGVRFAWRFCCCRNVAGDPRHERRQRFEAWRFDFVDQPSRPRRTVGAAKHRERFERRCDAPHRVLRSIVAGAGQRGRRDPGERRQRLAPLLERPAQVGGTSLKLCGLRLAVPLADGEQRIELRTVMPEQLGHGPRRNRRLDQTLHAAGVLGSAAFLQSRHQSVARRGELGERNLVEGVFGLAVVFRPAADPLSAFPFRH
jgi:hypothetical protein